MSLFVKGAKLPKIEGDKSIKAEIRCIGGKWEFGIMTGGYYCSQEWTFYPLSELPPHGNLKDADAFAIRIEEEAKKFVAMNEYDSGLRAGYRAAVKTAKLAPTIIEKEEY